MVVVVGGIFAFLVKGNEHGIPIVSPSMARTRLQSQCMMLTYVCDCPVAKLITCFCVDDDAGWRSEERDQPAVYFTADIYRQARQYGRESRFLVWDPGTGSTNMFPLISQPWNFVYLDVFFAARQVCLTSLCRWLSGRDRRRAEPGADKERADRREQGDDRIRHHEHRRVLHFLLPHHR